MSAGTTKFYNTFSCLYPLVDTLLRHQKKHLFREINELPPGNLLEIGVGNGSHLRYYQQHHITGIDTSKAMLDIARKNAGPDTILLEMDGTALLFDNGTYDYVVLSHVIAVVADPEKLLAEIGRVLKPGGQLLMLNHFTPDNPLKYVDKAFQPVARLFRFNSAFRLSELRGLQQFTLKNAIDTDPLSYFKLLIYQKP